MARFCISLALFALVGSIYAIPVINIDEDDAIDYDFPGKEIYGVPLNSTGDLVANWTPEMGNPEELGEYFEGDMLLPPSMAKSGYINTVYRWPGNQVPYEIVGTFTLAQRVLIISAMNDYSTNTCIRFVPRTTQRDYIAITSANNGCWSYLGRIGGRQELNLQAPGCVTLKGTAIHEFMHALGFIHEHSRPDRDVFVQILYQNIVSGAASNFNTYSSTVVSSFGVPYDYGSVMHYGRTAFSSNGRDTIVPRVAGAVIGQRNGFSARDIQSVRAMYKC